MTCGKKNKQMEEQEGRREGEGRRGEGGREGGTEGGKEEGQERGRQGGREAGRHNPFLQMADRGSTRGGTSSSSAPKPNTPPGMQRWKSGSSCTPGRGSIGICVPALSPSSKWLHRFYPERQVLVPRWRRQ